MEYGGYGGLNSNIYCGSASPTIHNCTIRHSDAYGIYTAGSGANPSITCSDIVSNNHGVYATSNSNPFISACNISGNTSSGVSNTTSAVTIKAEKNWWGQAIGPSGAGSGSGDAVSNYVDFTPWSGSFDGCLATINLNQLSDTNLVGEQHTVTATVEDDASADPIEGIEVSFNITSGPHAGQNGSDTTDSNGEATFTYTGTLNGADTIEASFVDFHGRTITSNAVTKTWELPATPIPTPSPIPSPEPSPTPSVDPISTYVPTPTPVASPSPEPSPTPEITPSPAPTPTEPPTAITLLYFQAKANGDGSVSLTWETATEVDNAGFNIYRAGSAGGQYAKVNNTLIPAKGSATSGARYRFTDDPGEGRYYYKLEDVDYNGVSTMHGPVSSKKAKRSGR